MGEHLAAKNASFSWYSKLKTIDDGVQTCGWLCLGRSSAHNLKIFDTGGSSVWVLSTFRIRHLWLSRLGQLKETILIFSSVLIALAIVLGYSRLQWRCLTVSAIASFVLKLHFWTLLRLSIYFEWKTLEFDFCTIWTLSWIKLYPKQFKKERTCWYTKLFWLWCSQLG